VNIPALLTISNIPGIGPVRARNLIAHFGSPEAALSAGAGEIAAIANIGPKIAGAFKPVDPDFADKQLEEAEKAGAQCLTYWDDDYPPYLKEIYDPPLVLFFQGSSDCLQQFCLAVVGTRKPSEYGRTSTKNIVAGLARQNLVIVSGLARGIDSLAHLAALDAGGYTVAVLGSGLDIDYPRENRKLRDRITEQGVVISEFPFGTVPDGRNFPRRNRIISGLSLGTLVMEAGERSGALITAAYAVDQNREVFALPGDVRRLQSAGCNRLIKTGRAALITSEMDILQVLQIQLSLKLEAPEAEKMPALSGDQLKIYQAVGSDSIYIDDLAQAVQMNPSETLTILLEMEMNGLINQVAGKRFVRS